jgi:hypothetical protein
MNRTWVRSLAPLAGLPLRRIGMLDTPVEDLSPLRNCRHLQMADVPSTATNLDCLAALPELRWLNGKLVSPAGETDPVKSNRVSGANQRTGSR